MRLRNTAALLAAALTLTGCVNATTGEQTAAPTPMAVDLEAANTEPGDVADVAVAPGPSSNYPVVKTIARGKKVTSVPSGGWVHVAAGQFVSATVVSTGKPSDKPAQPAPPKPTDPLSGSWTYKDEAEKWANIVYPGVEVRWDPNLPSAGGTPAWMTGAPYILMNPNRMTSMHHVRSVAVHEGFHVHQGYRYGDIRDALVPGTTDQPWEYEADAATIQFCAARGTSCTGYYVQRRGTGLTGNEADAGWSLIAYAGL